MARIESAPDRDTLLSELHDQHRALEARLAELDRHIALTSTEQVEWARIKKLKLLTKDQILQLERG